MRFLTDQDVYAATARFLGALDHDVLSVAETGKEEAADADLLRTAQAQQRILLTRDRDFGNLVFVEELGAGVIYLRMLPSTQHATHRELERVLQMYGEEVLAHAFVVVEPGRHRLRRLSP